jgi:hypothetical protein
MKGSTSLRRFCSLQVNFSYGRRHLTPVLECQLCVRSQSLATGPHGMSPQTDVQIGGSVPTGAAAIQELLTLGSRLLIAIQR